MLDEREQPAWIDPGKNGPDSGAQHRHSAGRPVAGVTTRRLVTLACGTGLLADGIARSLAGSDISAVTATAPLERSDVVAAIVVSCDATELVSAVERVQTRHRSPPTVLVLPDRLATRHGRALLEFVRGVISLESAGDVLVPAIDAVASGCSVSSYLTVPRHTRVGAVGLSLTTAEISILQRLSEGTSMLRLADTEACSERTMHRRLRVIYRKLGSGNRVQAVARATDLGLLDPPAVCPSRVPPGGRDRSR